MPLLGKINELAHNSLIEAKLIRNEEGPIRIKKLASKLIKKTQVIDKTELCRMSNHEIFVIFLLLTNDDTLGFEETINYCEEVKKVVNGWTFEKDGQKLLDLQQGINDDGTLRDLKYTRLISDLGLTPVFISYNMKAVYICMYDYLKLKKDILTPQDYIKKLPLPQRVKLLNGIYRKSRFSQFVDLAKESIENDMKDYEYRKEVAQQRIDCTNEVIKLLNDDELDKIEEFPSEWHRYLEPHLLELIYEIVLTNLGQQKIEIESKEKELLSTRNRSELTKYLYDNNLNPYSLNEKLEVLENIPNIISKIEFFRYLEIPLNNILTKYINYVVLISEEQIKSIYQLINNSIISKKTIKNNLNKVISSYNTIISNYEILKEIINFQNIYYNDNLLLLDIKEIKNRLLILKEYNLTEDNFIFLLYNFNYLHIYDLLLENNIPKHLFINICETQNPLNTLKRILIYMSIEESFETPNHQLKKEITSTSRFVCNDSDLDSYLPNIISQMGLNILNGDKIGDITTNPVIRYLDDEYKVEDTYLIGNNIISRPKVLRNFNQVNGNINYLMLALVSNSILTEQEYYNLINELNKKELKK